MAFEPKTERVQRVDRISLIDKIISFTVSGCNLQKIDILPQDLWIDLPKPYIMHDSQKGQTYFVGKEKTKDLGAEVVCTSKEFQEYTENTGIIYFEFVIEDKNDISPNLRAEEFLMQVNSKLRNYKIRSGEKEYLVELSRVSWPSTIKTDPKKTLYSHYFTFKTNDGCTVTPKLLE